MRPYVFAGTYDGDPVPGAIMNCRSGAAVCSEDAAWVFWNAGLQCVRRPHPPGTVYSSFPGLFPYQAAGAQWLAAHDWALLCDEMGLGKTAQALSAAEARLADERFDDSYAVLILCPALAKHHWAREVKRWTGHDADILESLTAKRDDLGGRRYVIANYDILYGHRRRDEAGKLNDSEKLPGWGGVLASLDFPIVICDEAHMLRGERSRRNAAVKAVAKRSTCMWLLTGTPMPNRVRDLWPLWDMASDGLAGWFWPWAKAYCDARKNLYGWEANGASRTEELRGRMSFWCLGRTKAQVGLQLPPFRREVVPVEVKVEKTTSMRAETDELPLAKSVVVDTALRATARAKRPAVVEMTKEALAAGQRVVVLVYLREQAEAIGKDLDAPHIVVTGAQSPEQRDVAAKAFREAEVATAFVATIDSVGVAISLVGADLLIFGDLSYEPAKLLQAEGRVHRIGSTSPVLCRYVTAAGMIDEAVVEAVVSKLDVQQDVLGENPASQNLQSALGYSKPTTEAVVSALFAKLVGK